ncbi:MAG: hypothetical protein QXH56_07365 [Thermoprotei archaeon]
MGDSTSEHKGDESKDDELTKSAKEFAESLVKLVSVTGKTVLKGVQETFPELSKSAQQVLVDLDKSVSDLFKSLDKATVPEQRELLSAYRKMLLVQLNKIEERLKKLDEQKGG